MPTITIPTQWLLLLSSAFLALQAPAALGADNTADKAGGSAPFPPPVASMGLRQNNRLSQLVQRGPRLFFPARLVVRPQGKLGATPANVLIVQGPPGQKVRVWASTQPEGGEAPNGMALRVGPPLATWEGVLSEKGVLRLDANLPSEIQPGDDGLPVYLDGVTWMSPDYADMARLNWVDATGRTTQKNVVLAVVLEENGKGVTVMPSMPGFSPQLLQRLNTLSEMQNGDARKRQLMESDALDRNLPYDRTPFINRPGALPSTPY